MYLTEDIKKAMWDFVEKECDKQQSKAAEKTGCSQSNWHRWLHGDQQWIKDPIYTEYIEPYIQKYLPTEGRENSPIYMSRVPESLKFLMHHWDILTSEQKDMIEHIANKAKEKKQGDVDPPKAKSA